MNPPTRIEEQQLRSERSSGDLWQVVKWTGLVWKCLSLPYNKVINLTEDFLQQHTRPYWLQVGDELVQPTKMFDEVVVEDLQYDRQHKLEVRYREIGSQSTSRTYVDRVSEKQRHRGYLARKEGHEEL